MAVYDVTFLEGSRSSDHVIQWGPGPTGPPSLRWFPEAIPELYIGLAWCMDKLMLILHNNGSNYTI